MLTDKELLDAESYTKAYEITQPKAKVTRYLREMLTEIYKERGIIRTDKGLFSLFQNSTYPIEVAIVYDYDGTLKEKFVINETDNEVAIEEKAMALSDKLNCDWSIAYATE